TRSAPSLPTAASSEVSARMGAGPTASATPEPAFVIRSGRTAGRRPTSSRRQDDALADRLRVEHAVGLLGLVEAPAVREELLHVDLVVGDELGAVGLALLGEGPRADQRHLPAQHVGAHVEGDLAALADEAGRAP